jgi:fumarylacetoacetate (FAA) hydrolase
MRLVSFKGGVGRLEGDAVVELEAPRMIDWLRGYGHSETGRILQDVELLAPVPDPPSVRDFYAYEEHVRTGSRLRGTDIPDFWFAEPVFYFSNPASILGPGAAVRPPKTEMLDFELEIAAVIGADGIAGFTLFNDWSARDVQRAEMSVGLGPAKGKDFATSIGPWLVTPDELPFDGDRLHLTATAAINGEVVTSSDAGAMHFTWPQILERAARDTRLRPGDVIGSGTLGRGCLLEFGDGRWLQPGDEVTLAAEGLGALSGQVTG